MTHNEHRVQIPGTDRRAFLQGFAGIAALSALGPALAACSSGSKDSAAAASASAGPGPGHYKLDLGGYQGPELDASKQVTLRFMRQDYTPEVNKMFQGIYDKFSAAYPHVTIKEELVPYGNLPTKLQVYVASGSAPDLMMGRNDFTSAYAAGKIALPLTPYLTPGFLSDLRKPLREAASVDSTLYCMPWDNNVEVLLFNRDIFKRAGVAAPPEPDSLDGAWTLDQWYESMAALTHNLRAKGDTNTWALASSTAGNGGPGSNFTQHESFWIRMMGDATAATDSDAYKTFAGVSADGFTASGYLNAQGAIDGMKNYQKLFQDGLTPKGIVPDQLGAGTAALSMDSVSVVNYYSHPQTKPKFNWGVTPWPKGQQMFNCNSSDAPIVWAKTPNPDAAVALLCFITNDANRLEFARLWGSMPARDSLIDQLPDYHGQAQKLAVATARQSSFGAPKSVGWFDYFNAVNPAVKDIALGADVAKTLDAAAKQIDAGLAKYR